MRIFTKKETIGIVIMWILCAMVVISVCVVAVITT